MINNLNIITDDWDRQSSYFCVKDAGVMAATARIIEPKDGLLELETNGFATFENIRPRLEVNRFAVDPYYASGKAPWLHFFEMSRFLKCRKGYEIYLTMAKTQPFQFCKNLGFNEAEQLQFKYTEADVNDIFLLKLDNVSGRKAIEIESLCEDMLLKY